MLNNPTDISFKRIFNAQLYAFIFAGVRNILCPQLLLHTGIRYTYPVLHLFRVIEPPPFVRRCPLIHRDLF